MPSARSFPVFRAAPPEAFRIDVGAAETTDVWRGVVAAELTAGLEKPAAVFFTQGQGICLCRTGSEECSAKLAQLNWQPAGEVYSAEGLAETIARENDGALGDLVAQLRSPMGVVPFVGAGMSSDFHFPGWGEFLRDGADLHETPAEVRKAVDAGEYLNAANLLSQDSPNGFQLRVARVFGREIREDEVRQSAAALLPMLTSGPVITTNFDRVLEAVFRAAGAAFDRIIPGPQPDHVVRAMHRNERVLLKIHGEAEDRTFRIFTGLEYDEQYPEQALPLDAVAKPEPAHAAPERANVSKLAWLMFTNRPLLFLGCSLDRDRTLTVLQRIHEALPALTHYAVLSASYRVEKLRERRRFLDGLGVSPLWFPNGDFARIRQILERLVQEASTRLILTAPRRPALEIDVLGRPLDPPGEPAGSVDGPAPAAEPEALLQRLARKITKGRAAFFLGAGGHLGCMPQTRQFYRTLAHDFEIDEKTVQEADVAQYIADREGTRELWSNARQMISVRDVQPSAVVRFLAQLPAFLRSGGLREESSLCIVTTNYDTVLEETFTRYGEPFHLLYYQADGPDEGLFLHRSIDGSVRVIERPENVTRFDGSAHVLVKLDGGIPFDPRMRESVSIAPTDFAATAGRLPKALPAAVRALLLDRSLLVLGSGLRHAHIQRLFRWSAGAEKAVKTWAVLTGATDSLIQYWAAAGVCVLARDLEAFILSLSQEVRRLCPAAAGACAAETAAGVRALAETG